MSLLIKNYNLSLISQNLLNLIPLKIANIVLNAKEFEHSKKIIMPKIIDVYKQEVSKMNLNYN